MSTWLDLDQELELWHKADQVPTFWWRDDDAHAATPALDRLLKTSARHHVPAHLSVIPAKLQPSLVARLADCLDVYTLQHGFAHVNYEPKGHGASEFGDHRPMADQIGDLTGGWDILLQAEIPRLLPVFVPPWNRMAHTTAAQLQALGYKIVSAYGTHTARVDHGSLQRIDGHADPIRWKHANAFRGTASMLDLIITHLADRRTGRADIAQPTGFLTHHLQTEPAVWDFADALFERLSYKGIAQWVTLPELIQDARTPA